MNSLQWTAQFEGRRNIAYWDPIGKVWTNGIGHTGEWINDKGETVAEVVEGQTWSETEIDLNYQLDHTKAESEAMNAIGGDLGAVPFIGRVGIKTWDVLNDARRAVLIDLAFELGLAGEERFTTFLRLVQNRMYVAASQDLQSTVLAHQVPKRVAANAWAMKTGTLELPPAHLS